MWKRLRFAPKTIANFDGTKLIRDLMSYWSMSRYEVITLLEANDVRDILLEWIKRCPNLDTIPCNDRERGLKLMDFYQEYPNNIIHLAKCDLTSEYWQRVQPATKLKGKITVFGGIGTTAILLTQLGNDVTYIELPSKHREFAEWRFVLHGYLDKQNIKVRLGFEQTHDLDAVVIEFLYDKTILSSIANSMFGALKPKGEVVVIDNLNSILASEFSRAMSGFTFNSNSWVKEM